MNRASPLPLRALLTLLALIGVFATATAGAQDADTPNSLLLVAKPELLDPNFRRTVVLVTQAPDASTVGVILNRPLVEPLREFLGDDRAANYADRVYEGGPVMRTALLAVFRAAAAPAAPAFPVLKGIYLTLHPDNIEALFAGTSSNYRVYAGFSAWAPRQLQSEFMRDGWYVLPADAETIFRVNTAGMWEEMLRRATKPKPTTRRKAAPLAEYCCPASPGRGALAASWPAPIALQ